MATKFNGYVDFLESRFNGATGFRFSKFREDADFLAAKFSRDADFWYSEFKGNASFLTSEFNGAAGFSESEFNGTADFGFSKFKGIAFFRKSNFSRDAIFRQTEFNGDVFFENSRFNETADFRYSLFKGRTYFQAFFQGPLDLRGIEFNELRVSWDSIKNNLICDGPVYIELIRSFKNLEQFEDADNCYFQYRILKQNGEPFGLPKLIDYFALISCGYGVKPVYTLACLVFLIFSFGFLFWWRKGVFMFRSDWEFEVSLKDALYFSLMSFIGASTAIRPKEGYKFLVATERLLGWLLLALFLVTLNHVMIRP